MINISENEKLIYAGLSQPENHVLNDMWVFNYEKVQFSSGLPEIPGAVCTKKQQNGDIPQPRYGNVAIKFQKFIYLYGGKADNSEQIY